MLANSSNKQIGDFVDRLGEEYKEILVNEVLDSKKEKEISQDDMISILKLDNQAKSTLKLFYQKRLFHKYFKTVSILGGVYCFFALILLFLSLNNNNFFFGEKISSKIFYYIGLMSSLISLLSSILVILIDKIDIRIFKLSKRYDLYREVVILCKELEALSIQISPIDNKTDFNNNISHLMDIHLLSTQNIKTIEKLNLTRNQILEKGSSEFSDKEIEQLILDSKKIVKRMEKFA